MGTKKLSAAEIAKQKRQIRDRERRFKAMTKPEKQVAIAKDVLRQITSKKIQPKRGIYLSGSVATKLNETRSNRLWISPSVTKEFLRTEVRDLFVEKPACTACAIGAMFVCDIFRRDALTVDSATARAVFNNEDLMRKRLNAYFSMEQLRLIEVAFEGRFLALLSCSDEIAAECDKSNRYARARDFNEGVASATARMKNIMKNIIRNNGTFTP